MNEVENLKKALERERKARKAAEKIIEEKSAELYHFTEELKNLNRNLEEEIARRTREIEILALFPEEIPDPVLRVSRSGQIVYANPASRESLLPYFKLAVGDSFPALFQSSIEKALATDKPVSQAYQINNSHYLIYFSGLRELGYINILARDISEIKNTQDQLSQSEKRYRQIIESASDVIYRISPEGYFTYINPTAVRLLNISEQEISSVHFTSLIHPGYRKKVEKFYARQLKSKQATTYLEFPLRLRSGREIWIGQNVQLYQESGKVRELTALARDITDRKQAEEALLLTSTRLSTLIGSMHTGVMVEDENRNIVLVNNKFCSLFGLHSARELEGQKCSDCMEKFRSLFADSAAFELSMNQVMARKKLVIAEEIKFADGRIMERDYVPIVMGRKFLGHLWQYRDVTDKRKSEARLIRSQAALLEAQELAKLGNWEYSLQTDTLQWSEQIYRQYGLDPNNPPPSQNARKFIHPDDADRVSWELKNSINSGYHSFDQRIVRPDGEVRYLQITVKPEFCLTGSLKGFYGTSLDITELRKTEAQLQESEERFNLAVQGTNDGIWDWNLLNGTIFFSPQWKQMMGYQDHELLNEYNTWVRLLHPDDKDYALDSLQAYLKSDTHLLSIEYRMCHRDGRYRNILTKGIMVKDAAGKALRVVGSNSDITERKETEKKVFRNLQQQKLISDISFLFSSVMEDLDAPVKQALSLLGKHTDVSRVYIFENASDEVFTSNTFEWCNRGIEPQIDGLQNVPYSIFPSLKKKLLKGGIICHDTRSLPEDLREVLEPQQIQSILVFPFYIKKIFSGFVGFDECLSRRQWDESEIQLLKTFSNLLGNVFERQEAEIQVIRSEEKYRSVIDNLTEVIFQINEKSVLTFLNPAWTDITGYSLEESVGQTLTDYIYPADRPEMDELYELLMDQRIDFCRQSLRIYNKNGKIRWIEIYARLTVDKFNQIEGISGTINDVTDRKLADEALIKAKEEAEQASQAKAHFLSTMSHEIRTPMNAVIGITNLLLNNSPRPDQAKSLNLLKFSGENLLHLLNDILDFSKIEAGKIQFEEVDFSIKNLLSGIKQSLAIRANEKGIKLHMLTDEGLPDMLLGDPTRLSQVLNNLLGNAIKFTERGSVSLRVDIVENSPFDILLEFSICDTGIGIAREKLHSIFESFSQASTNTTRIYGGTGLGLTITKKLLELQGSQIQVESEPGKGSTFCFQLSFRRSFVSPIDQVVQQADEQANWNLNEQRILLVEDNPVNIVVASHFLESWGVEVVVAEHGLKACELVEKHQFSLVLMDLQMPVMDGFQASKRLREKFNAQQLPVIALTANTMQGIKDHIFAAGMNDYISKPFTPDELYKKIIKHLRLPLSQAPGLKTAQKTQTDLDYKLDPAGDTPFPLYKLDKLLNQTGGNHAFMKRMALLFISTSPAQLDEMQHCLQQQKLKQLQNLAHKLKPSVDMLDIESQKQQVRLIEKMDEATFLSPEGQKMVSAFISCMRSVNEKLKSDPVIA